MNYERAGWDYDCDPGCFRRWERALPNDGWVTVYHNLKIEFSLCEPGVEWEFEWETEGDFYDAEPIPDECKTLSERLAYALTMARMT